MGKIEKTLIVGLVFTVCTVINSIIYQSRQINYDSGKVEDHKAPTVQNMYYQERVEQAKPYFNEYGYISLDFTMPDLRNGR